MNTALCLGDGCLLWAYGNFDCAGGEHIDWLYCVIQIALWTAYTVLSIYYTSDKYEKKCLKKWRQNKWNT